jgi:hypothetical protein
MSPEPAPQPLSGKESPAAPLSGSESQAPALSGSESQAPALTFWLQLMLAEIGAKREALEGARAEEALRQSERSAASAASKGSAPQS